MQPTNMRHQNQSQFVTKNEIKSMAESIDELKTIIKNQHGANKNRDKTENERDGRENHWNWSEEPMPNDERDQSTATLEQITTELKRHSLLNNSPVNKNANRTTVWIQSGMLLIPEQFSEAMASLCGSVLLKGKLCNRYIGQLHPIHRIEFAIQGYDPNYDRFFAGLRGKSITVAPPAYMIECLDRWKTELSQKIKEGRPMYSGYLTHCKNVSNGSNNYCGYKIILDGQ